MEIRKGRNGKRLWTVVQKREILSELDKGLTAEEISRKYELHIQTLYQWRRRYRQAGDRALRSNQEMVSLREWKKLKEENKRLQQALGKMTVERDILNDAVEIAAKKKWI